jgi:4-diphosphocytidyl-2-C-methyl-D-erythritol kinase
MRARAFAKINLGLVVGRPRPDGKHEVTTVLERVDLHDMIEVEHSGQTGIAVEGFPEDTLVRRSLARFDEVVRSRSGWRVHIEKHIPLSSGLGGGSSDAGAALRLANELTERPLSRQELHELAAEIGSDVPFFLTAGAKLATGDGTELEPVELPRDYWVVLVLAHGERKPSTRGVYQAIDTDAAGAEFAKRRRALLDALDNLDESKKLRDLPDNRLAGRHHHSRLGAELRALGAFRVDTSGAGPTVYGLFEHEDEARRAAQTLRKHARTWLARPVPGP